MKKFISVMNTVIMGIFLLFILNLFTFFAPFENEKPNNNEHLFKKIEEIEQMIVEIKKYDNSIYLQLLNLNYDTTQIAIFDVDDTLNMKILNIHNELSKKIIMYKNISNELTNKNKINQYPSISPINTEDFLRISSGFGWRLHPIHKTPLFHNGIDIITKKNTNIYSTVDGRVDKVIYSKYGYGNRILIKNSSGYEIVFAHLSNYIYVKKGHLVKKGQLIAKSGNTGTSTGEHLHYEIRINQQPVDPLMFFHTYTTNLIAKKL